MMGQPHEAVGGNAAFSAASQPAVLDFWKTLAGRAVLRYTAVRRLLRNEIHGEMELKSEREPEVSRRRKRDGALRLRSCFHALSLEPDERLE